MTRERVLLMLLGIAMALLLLLIFEAVALPIRTKEQMAECKWQAVLAYRAAIAHQTFGMTRAQFHWTDEDDDTSSAAAQRAAVARGWEWDGPPEELAQVVFANCYGEQEV